MLIFRWDAYLFYVIVCSLLAFWLWRGCNRLVIRWFGYRQWYLHVSLYSPNWYFSRWVKFLVSGRLQDLHRRDVHHKVYTHLWHEWLFPNDLEIVTREQHEAIEARKQNKRRG